MHEITKYFPFTENQQHAGVEEGSEARPVRSAVKSISDHPIYSPPLDLDVLARSTESSDGMVTDRSCMHRAVQRLDATLDSDIVPDSQ